MQLYAIIIAALAATSSVQACITAHVYQNNCIISGDVLSAQVFDNGKKVCDGSSEHDFASGKTEFCISGCQKGYSFCVTDNVGTAKIQSPNGYRATMKAVGRHDHEFTCANWGNKKIKGTEYEACFTDNNASCSKFPKCSTCDFKAHC